MWMVLLANALIPQERYLAEDETGYHTTSKDKATRFESEASAETAKAKAAEEWPEADFTLVLAS